MVKPKAPPPADDPLRNLMEQVQRGMLDTKRAEEQLRRHMEMEAERRRAEAMSFINQLAPRIRGLVIGTLELRPRGLKGMRRRAALVKWMEAHCEEFQFGNEIERLATYSYEWPED